MNIRLLALAFCALTASAGAAAVPLKSLFAQGQAIPKTTSDPDQVGGVEADADVAQYWMPIAGGAKLRIGTTAYWPMTGQANKTDHVELYAQSAAERLNSAEIARLGNLASKAAQACFNVKGEHGAALKAWLMRLNSGAARQQSAQFGPLTVTYSRQKDGNNWNSFVDFTRSGTPGQASWVGYCSV